MRIAILNLPVDNNYGGNLQRYALMKVLQNMGHDVTHIDIESKWTLPWYKKPYSYPKRFILRYLLHRDIHINEEFYRNRQDEKRIENVLPFYNKYIKHTKKCYSINDVINETKDKFDAYVVGSDQVWRKSMCGSIGWRNFLLEFTKGEHVKRIAYAVSFGIDSSEYNREEYDDFKKLFSSFDSVSVRESLALRILESMGCHAAGVSVCLDPTLLLDKFEWEDLCEGTTLLEPTKGKIFCYVLDMTEEIKVYIKRKSEELNLQVIIAGLSETTLSITEWLLSIHDAAYVITDSYHGTVFSIIFEKQFHYCGNIRRGNSRIQSLFEITGIKFEDTEINWERVNYKLSHNKKVSMSFLKIMS